MNKNQPVTEHRLAARTVALQVRIPKRTNNPHRPGRHELLDMLGLLDPDTGDIIEPPPGKTDKPSAIATVHGASRAVTRQPSGETPLRDRSSLPPGLRRIPKSEAQRESEAS